MFSVKRFSYFFIATLVVITHSTAQNLKMNTEIKESGRRIEPWQLDDAARLLDLFKTAKAAAKKDGKKLTQETLAETSGIASPNMVWQYLHGHRPLNPKAASAFAKGLGVQVKEFSPTLAAEIDSTFGKAVSVGAWRTEHKGDYSLSIEKLLMIEAISEREAMLLSKFRKSDETWKKKICDMADIAEEAMLAVANHQAKS